MTRFFLRKMATLVRKVGKDKVFPRGPQHVPLDPRSLLGNFYSCNVGFPAARVWHLSRRQKLVESDLWLSRKICSLQSAVLNTGPDSLIHEDCRAASTFVQRTSPTLWCHQTWLAGKSLNWIAMFDYQRLHPIHIPLNHSKIPFHH